MEKKKLQIQSHTNTKIYIINISGVSFMIECAFLFSTGDNKLQRRQQT